MPPPTIILHLTKDALALYCELHYTITAWRLLLREAEHTAYTIGWFVGPPQKCITKISFS